MKPIRYVLSLGCLLFVMSCSKPSEDEIENNLIGNWTIEYYDEYARDNWDDNENHNGELIIHNELVGQIEFRSDKTGVLNDSAYSQTFTWRVNENYLIFEFPLSASSNDSHTIVDHYFNSRACDSEIKSYSILLSTTDTHVFRYRSGGSCNMETFHCLEWAITK